MSDFGLIMISAMYENGGNTTHRLFDGHPSLLVYPFESQLGTAMVSDFLSSYVPYRYRWPEFSVAGTPEEDYEAFWDEELRTLLRAPQRSKFKGCGLEMSELDRKQAFVEWLRDRPRSRANIVAAYFHSAFAAWRNCVRSGRETAYLGYNPVQVLDTEKILSDFPDGQIIHVVRNPYSGYADTKKRPFPISLARYCWTWNLCQHMALTYQRRHPKQFHLVRFEDLVADTGTTMRDLCQRLGLGFFETCLYPSFNGTRLESVYPWGTIRTPSAEANLATRNELSAHEVSEVRSLTSVLLPLLDYEAQ